MPSRGESTTVVQDHLAQRGGAERVFLSIASNMPRAALKTSVYAADRTYPELRELPIEPMAISQVGAFQRNHRLAFPLMAPLFSMQTVDTPVALCCSAGWSHGVRAKGRKVIYWFAPARWLHQRSEYVGTTGITAKVVAAMAPALERWDRRAVDSADRHLAVSSAIAVRLKQVYGIDSEVLHPPVTLDDEPEPVPEIEPGYLLAVSRLIGYKNITSLMDAMRDLPEQTLIIAGVGPHRDVMERDAPANVRFIGLVSDAELVWLYQNCAAVVSAAYEDFGLTPLEAAQYGRPAVALRAGGFLDTIVEGTTGVFFNTLDPTEIRDALEETLATDWDVTVLQKHSAEFSEERFLERLNAVLSEELRRANL